MPDPERPGSEHDQAPLTGPRLPSRRTTAALAGVVLLVSIGLGAALPGGRSSSLALGAGSPLTASLLGAIAADRAGSGSSAAPQAAPPSSQASGEETAQEETGREKGKSAKAQTNSKQETEASGPETEGASAEAEGGSGAGESANPGTSGSSGSSKSKTGAPVSPALLAQITHVWVISLSSGSFAAALQHPTTDPYLAKQLVPKGVLLMHYELVGDGATANEIALLSGQGPNAETQRDCPIYVAIAPASVDSHGLAGGAGCVYPTAVKTLAEQATEAALTWRAYVQDMAPASTTSTPSQAPTAGATCRHPQPGGSESSTPPSAGNDYLVSRNPFVYFDSLLESQACAKDDVDLSQLSVDLTKPSEIPNLSWIVPSACDDGSQTNCGAGAATGLAGADAFLGKVVPQITATAAYREHGLILITFDSGSSLGAKASARGASSTNARSSATTQGGSQVGTLILSPFVRAGVRVAEPLTTYSLLKSLERLFGVPLLGHAADQGVTELDAQVYRTASNTTLVRAAPRRGPSQTSG